MQPETTIEEGGGKIMCCKNCSSAITKCGYYLTFVAGLIIFAVGKADLFRVMHIS